MRFTSLLSESITDKHRVHWERLKDSIVTVRDGCLFFDDSPVMFESEFQILEKYASLLLASKKNARVLDVGFGMGIFASTLNSFNISGYVGIELNTLACQRGKKVLSGMNFCNDAMLLNASWQEVVLNIGEFDAILYDTWPPNGYEDNDFRMFVECCKHGLLKENGRFGYVSIGAEFSMYRVKILLEQFKSVHIEQIKLFEKPNHWHHATTCFHIIVASL